MLKDKSGKMYLKQLIVQYTKLKDAKCDIKNIKCGA